MVLGSVIGGVGPFTGSLRVWDGEIGTGSAGQTYDGVGINVGDTLYSVSAGSVNAGTWAIEFFSGSLSTVVTNWNNGSYANLGALSTALNAIFTPIGETGFFGSATGGKVTINDKQNLTTIDGAISQNITSLDPVASGHGGKQVYLWATDDANWASATALAVVTDTSWIIPANNASNVTVNTAYIDLSSPSELVLGMSGSVISGVNSISLIPEPSSSSLLLLSFAFLLSRRCTLRTLQNRIQRSRD